MPMKEYVGTAEIKGVTTNTRHRLDNFTGTPDEAARILMQHNPELKNLRVIEIGSTDQPVSQAQFFTKPSDFGLPPGVTRTVGTAQVDPPQRATPEEPLLQPKRAATPAVPMPEHPNVPPTEAADAEER